MKDFGEEKNFPYLKQGLPFVLKPPFKKFPVVPRNYALLCIYDFGERRIVYLCTKLEDLKQIYNWFQWRLDPHPSDSLPFKWYIVQEALVAEVLIKKH